MALCCCSYSHSRCFGPDGAHHMKLHAALHHGVASLINHNASIADQSSPAVSRGASFQAISLSLCPVAVRRVPPRFSIPPTDNEIMPGGSVNITCVAVGSPMPYVKWMLGAEDLTPEDDMPIGRNVLELTDVRQSANYTCVAMSTLGVIEAVAQITVKGTPFALATSLIRLSYNNNDTHTCYLYHL